MIKFKDSDCYPIEFDLFRLIAISDKLTFPMVWHGKYYLKKVIQIDKDSICSAIKSSSDNLIGRI